MLTLALYGLLALLLAGALFLLAAYLLPAGEQIAPPIRDEPLWDLPAGKRLDRTTWRRCGCPSRCAVIGSPRPTCCSTGSPTSCASATTRSTGCASIAAEPRWQRTRAGRLSRDDLSRADRAVST